MNRWKWAFGAALGSAAILGTLAPLAPAQAGKAENSVSFAYDQAPESIDPYFNNVRIGVIIGHHVWDTLIYRDPKTNEYQGLLATAWRQVDDRTLEFDLRQGVTFHNGEPFDADDVVHTLNFIADPANKVVTQTNVSWIEGAEKLGPHKVRLTTKEPFPAAIEYLAGPIAIHPNEYYAEVGPEGQNKEPVGTGPYKVTSYDPGKSVTLERNENYFAGSPKGTPEIAGLAIRFIPDRQTQMAEVLSGGIDFIMHVPADQAEQVGMVPHLKVVSGETMRIVFLNINSQEDTPNPALKDERVRQALIHAIDRETIVQSIVGEGARVLHTICFPTQFGCTDQGAPRYEYDPEKAKQLLDEAGHPNGLAVDILAYRERNQTEAIINYLREAGISADLEFLQYAAMREQIRNNQAELTHQTWGSFSVNDVSASTPHYFGMGPDDITDDPEVASLLEKGNTSIDPAVRKEAYQKALTIIAEKAYAVPLWSLPVNYVATADLEFQAYPDEIPRFWEMSWK